MNLASMKVGILGGGQLAYMLYQSLLDWGLTASILDNDPDSPASHLSGFVLGDPLNYDDVVRFCEPLDIVTLDRESVCLEALMDLDRKGSIKVFPPVNAIEIGQNKLLQKQFFEENGIPCVSYRFFESGEDLIKKARMKEDYPCMVKAISGGYDGYGVQHLKFFSDVLRPELLKIPCILENHIMIEREFAIVAARSVEGDYISYPVAEFYSNEHNSLSELLVPSQLPAHVIKSAESIVFGILEGLDYVGIIGVEFFFDVLGNVIVNEFAPRVHNTGHYTQDACQVSQFQQHWRAIFGLPLFGSSLHTGVGAVMLNLIGDRNASDSSGYYEAVLRKLEGFPSLMPHFYHKKTVSIGRKMGHVNAVSTSILRAHGLLQSANLIE